MSRQIVVVGAGGFGRETLDIAVALQRTGESVDIVGVVDDAPSEVNLERLRDRGVRFLGRERDYALQEPQQVVIAIGDPHVRSRVAVRWAARGATFATLIDPTATVGTRPHFGQGTVVCAGARISTNVRIGAHGHVNPGAIIGHDVRCDDFVSVNPGAILSGEVEVRTRSLIGAGAVVLQGLRIGEGCTVGAAACVTRDVARSHTVKGVPAR